MATATASSKQPSAGGEPKASASSSVAFDWNAGDKCPIGDSLSILYEDNRRQVLETLRRHPVTGTLLLDDYDNEAEMEEPDWTQRLVFVDEALRGLVLRNVLRGPADDGVANVVGAAGAKKKDRRKRRQQQQQQERDGEGETVPYPPRLGIVGTRVIRHDVTDDGATGGGTAAAISLAGAMGVNVGTEGEAVLVNEAVEENEVRDDMADRTDLLIYYVRPNPADARLVAHKIRRYRDKFARASHHHHHGGGPARQPHHRIVFLPQCTSVCERVLLDEGVLPLDVVSVSELHLDLIPLDRDVLSMELPDVLRECDVDGCPSCPVTAVARSIVKMQDLCGVIPRVQGLGPLASAVIEQAMSIRVQEHYEDGGEADDGGGIGEEKKGDDGGAVMMDDAGRPRRDIDAMIVLDRKVDLVTPMLTPLTYEGLIDEVIGIEGGYIRIDESLMEPDGDEESDKTGEEASKTTQQQAVSTNPFDDPSSEPSTPATPKPRKIALALNGSDTLYDEVRNQNVEKFGSFLQDQARALRESHGHFRTTKTKRDLTEIHHFVKQIPIFTQNLRSLTLHIHLAETLKRTTDGSDFRQRWHTERSMVEGETCYDALEDLVATGREPPYDFLRLLCLQSLTGGGLKSAKFDSLRREVVQTYGYGYLFVLNNLEKMGMLRRREGIMPVSTWVADAASGTSSSGGVVLPYSSLRRLLTLINAEVNNVEPDDVSYVSSGYAPLAVRLVQAALSPRGWTGKEEVLRSLPGGLVDVVQRVDGDGVPEEMRQATRRGGPPPRPLAAEAAAFASSSGNEQQQQRGGGGNTGTTATKKKPVLLIYFVGGVTYMEIAALRFLNGRPGFPFRILCCTTKVINGSTLLRSLS